MFLSKYVHNDSLEADISIQSSQNMYIKNKLHVRNGAKHLTWWVRVSLHCYFHCIFVGLKATINP